MSSMPGASAPPVLADAASAQGVVQWILPAGARHILAAAVMAVAVGLAYASDSVPGSSGRAIVPAPDLLIDLNTVPAPVLETLPHVGQTLVRQLVAARELRPLASLEDTISRVRGSVPPRRPSSGHTSGLTIRRRSESRLTRALIRIGRMPNHARPRKRIRSRKPPVATLPSRLVAQRTE